MYKRQGLEWVAYRLGFAALGDGMVPAVQRIGQLIGVGIMGYLVWRYKAKHPVRTLGWILIAFVLTGPVIHPWYCLLYTSRCV